VHLGLLEKSFLQAFQYRQRLSGLMRQEELREFALLTSARLGHSSLYPLEESMDQSDRGVWDPQDYIYPSSFELLKRFKMDDNGSLWTGAGGRLPLGRILRSIEIGGRNYHPRSSSPFRSIVGYSELNGTFKLGVGEILEIFQYRWEIESPVETYVVLDSFKPVLMDPFTDFPEVGAKVFSQTAARTKILQPAQNLLSIIISPWSNEDVVVFLLKETYVDRRF
jgi:hypothetical protein